MTIPVRLRHHLRPRSAGPPTGVGHLDGQRAQPVGASAGRYWVAFGLSLLAVLVLWGLIVVGLIVGVLFAVF